MKTITRSDLQTIIDANEYYRAQLERDTLAFIGKRDADGTLICLGTESTVADLFCKVQFTVNEYPSEAATMTSFEIFTITD